MDPASILLIVTGAHLDAEAHDRPVAYRLREVIRERLAALGDGPLQPLVCSDLWYLNNEPLRARPTISIGAPAVNALSAFLAGRLPSVFTIDDRLIVQADLEMIDLAACCWGADHASTAAAAEAFTVRYLEDFLRAAIAAS
jgi:hypothetical protein